MTQGFPPLDLLPDGRRQLLRLIKVRGSVSAGEAARELEITPSGARQHLAALESAGLVAHRRLSSGPGRPQHRYALTERGDTLFPRRHGEMTVELLGYLEEGSPDLLPGLFARRSRRRLEDARERLPEAPLEARVRELARILDEDGYLAAVEPREEGGFFLVEHNCAVRMVAERYGHACSSELDFLREALPDADVRRVSHIVRGAPTCAYEVVPRDPSSS